MKSDALDLKRRRLAVDTYIKVHVERAAGARLLVASYFRLIFTLSLATLAAIVTLASALVRFGAPNRVGLNDPATLTALGAAVVALIVSAVLAADGLRALPAGRFALFAILCLKAARP